LDRLRLGGFGCGAGTVAGLLVVAGSFGGGSGLSFAGYGLGAASGLLLTLGSLELKRRFGTLLFPLGGALITAGFVATLGATVASMEGVRAAIESGNTAAIAGALAGVLLALVIMAVGFVLLGVGLVLKRRAVAEALGVKQDTLVLAAGIFLILTLLLGTLSALAGLVILMMIFLRLAAKSEAAPTSPAPPPG
jgi:hypothetical protein